MQGKGICEITLLGPGKSDSAIDSNMYKSYKSRVFLIKQYGRKFAHAEFPGKLAMGGKSWKSGCRLPKIKNKVDAKYNRPKCNSDNKVHGCFSYLQGDVSRYVPFWEQAHLNRKIPVPLTYFVELIDNQLLHGLCYGCDRKIQKHFHHEKPVRTGGGYTYFSKKARATTGCTSAGGSSETYGIPEDDLASLTMLVQQLLSLAAETDLLQHMKRLASCTMVHKAQDKHGLELLKEFLEYDCGLKLEEECIRKSPNGKRSVEEAPWRSVTAPSEPLNPQHIQPPENLAVLLTLLRCCQLKGKDAKGFMEFLSDTLLNKWPDGEEVIHETSTKEQLIDDGCWLVSQGVHLPKPIQNIPNKDKGGFEQSNLIDLKSPKKHDEGRKEEKLLPVFNTILMLPKLLREEEEKMLLQSLQNMSSEEKIVFLRQHGLLQDSVQDPFIPGLSERPRCLWTEPKPFKVQHKKIFTRPMSPFSNDREYNIRSLQENFHVHKSDKEVTQFIKVQIPQMASNSSPLQKMKILEDSRRKEHSSNTQPILPSHHGNVAEDHEPPRPVVGSPGNPEMKGSDVGSRKLPGEKFQKPQQQFINQVTALEPESLLTKLIVDGRKERQPDGPQESSVQQTKSSEAKKAKIRKPSKDDMGTAPCQQKNVIEVHQMQKKMSHSQELYSAPQSNFKSDSEGNHEMISDRNQETSWLSTASLQSTDLCEWQPNITKYYPEEHVHDIPCELDTVERENSSDTKKKRTKKSKCPFVSISQLENNMQQQSEPDSLVHLDTSTERTKSYPLQPVTVIPSDALEDSKNECEPKPEKPPDSSDDRQTNEQAAEAIVTGKGKRESLPRVGFTKRKPLPSIKRNVRRNSQQHRVMVEETQRFRPNILDFLTKYCIINPERLPFYERIFLKYCNHEDTEEARDQESADTSDTSFNYTPGGFDHIEEIFIQKKAKENIDIEGKIQMILGSGSISDQLEKIKFKMKKLLERKKYIVDTVQELQDQRMQLQATMTKQHSYTADQKRKKRRKRGKEKMFVPNMDEKEDNLYRIPSSALTSMPPGVPVKQANAYKNLELKIHLFWNKYKEISSRLSELSDTKRILELKNKEDYLEAIIRNSKIPPEERRLQSALYRRLHPNKDLVLDINDLEEALQDVNKCLVSPKEFSYIFHILELPGKYRLNLELFCIVAALSEKVTQLDPVIKKLINKLDFEALSVRIEKAKDLWHLLQDCEGEKERKTNKMSCGSVSIHSLALELAAGGFSLEAINFAIKKFNRTEASVLSFLDFVTYIPLFVEIHEGIVQNPLSLIPNIIPDLGDELHMDVNWNTE